MVAPPQLTEKANQIETPELGLWQQIKEDWNAHGRDWTKPGFRAVAVQRFGVWRMQIEPKLLRAPLSILYRALYRPQETGITRRKHCNFWRGLYGDNWLIAFDSSLEWVESMLSFVRNKKSFYLMELRAIKLIRKPVYPCCRPLKTDISTISRFIQGV